MSLREELIAASERYSATFADATLAARPARRFAVVTCMDARLDPARVLGLEPGDAHVVRNAGAVVTDDVLRSLVASHALLGTSEAYLVAHTDCGLLGASEQELDRIAAAAGVDTSEVGFLPFVDLEQHVREGLERISRSPQLPDAYAAGGFVYDVRTGRLREVATRR